MSPVPEQSPEPGGAAPRPLIIVHLMKTGGFSLLYHVLANVPRPATWGIPEDETDELWSMEHYSSVERLSSLDDETRSGLEVVMGHLPFAAVGVAGFDGATIATVLRDPVDRVISYLAMCKANNTEHRDLPLEQIYEDEFFGPRTIRNHQTKMLGMTAAQATTRPPMPEEPPNPLIVEALFADGFFDSPRFAEVVNRARFGTELIDTPLVWPVPVDESTLANARENLERVDVLGLHEDFDDFLERLGRLMGWTIDREIRVNRGTPAQVPPSFRRRIEEGNVFDLELYEHARGLVGG